ncbi:nucleoside 2-deoxyribosyltransferase [Burkholderia alba]|uniref:nucleoside 2-deoxyribosyltransferase n=1 Tax=Burkholderia alba TaxID=2683677 RepID=UPI002B05D975|nr:nucleoside 2-deoxyribosyltransferase [Burkholderia alba]
MTASRIYLAGFDVFRADAYQHGGYLKTLCEQAGLLGLFPLDLEIDDETGTSLQVARIYESNLSLLRSCDVVMANLDDFRGAGEPDSGTAFEVGVAVALNKLVFAYTEVITPLIGRISHRRNSFGQAYCERGYRIEDFGLPMNLKLACSVTLVEGGPVECLAELVKVLDGLAG